VEVENAQTVKMKIGNGSQYTRSMDMASKLCTGGYSAYGLSRWVVTAG